MHPFSHLGTRTDKRVRVNHSPLIHISPDVDISRRHYDNAFCKKSSPANAASPRNQSHARLRSKLSGRDRILIHKIPHLHKFPHTKSPENILLHFNIHDPFARNLLRHTNLPPFEAVAKI